jgi:hypothetical protein
VPYVCSSHTVITTKQSKANTVAFHVTTSITTTPRVRKVTSVGHDSAQPVVNAALTLRASKLSTHGQSLYQVQRENSLLSTQSKKPYCLLTTRLVVFERMLETLKSLDSFTFHTVQSSLPFRIHFLH